MRTSEMSASTQGASSFNPNLNSAEDVAAAEPSVSASKPPAIEPIGQKKVRRASTFWKLQRAVQRHRERMNSSELSISSLVLKRKALTKKFVIFFDEEK